MRCWKPRDEEGYKGLKCLFREKIKGVWKDMENINKVMWWSSWRSSKMGSWARHLTPLEFSGFWTEMFYVAGPGRSFCCSLSDKRWKYCGFSCEGANWNPPALSRSMLRLHLTILSSPSSGSCCLIGTTITGFYWSLRNQDLPSSLNVADNCEFWTSVRPNIHWNHLHCDQIYTRNFWNLFFKFTIKTLYNMCVYLNKDCRF